MASIAFFVPGIPKPGGSKTAYRDKRTGRINIVDACVGNKDWRATVSLAAAEAMNKAGLAPFLGPLFARFVFFMPRPKDHYRKDGAIRESYLSQQHTCKPDITKLVRAAEDACTGIVWHDDSLIVGHEADKRYVAPNESPGLQCYCVEIVIDDEGGA